MKAGNEIVERQIYSNVWILLNKYGHKGWNMDDLARLSGVAKNTLYKIVGNKEALLSKVVFAVQDEYIAVLESATRSDEPLKALYSLTERIPKIFTNYNITSIREFLRLYPKLSAEYKCKEERMTNALLTLYERGLEHGFVRSDIDVHFLVKMQTLVREQMIETSESPEALAHNLRNALIIMTEGVIIRESDPC